MEDLNDKITGSILLAADWNQPASEIQNVIEGIGISLSAGDQNQLGKAIAGYVANGTFYIDNGATVNAYVLTVIGLKQAPPEYSDGLEAEFRIGITNTGLSTVNVAGLGVKNIAGSSAPGVLVTGNIVRLRYNIGTDKMDIVSSIITANIVRFAKAVGIGNAFSAAFVPEIESLTNDDLVRVRSINSNTITNPTFNPDNLGISTITKNGNQPLDIGDIPGADYDMLLSRNNDNDVWELLNAYIDKASIQLALFATGDIKLTYKNIADNGWILVDNGSIGNALSEATNRNNADTEALFTLMWNNMTDAECPVSSGRGASAAADFSADKDLTIPIALGHAIGVAGNGAMLSPRVLGDTVGQEEHALTLAELAEHDHKITVLNETDFDVNRFPEPISSLTTITQDTSSTGSGAPFEIMQPTTFMNTMIKL